MKTRLQNILLPSHYGEGLGVRLFLCVALVGLLFVSCTEDFEPTYLDNLKVSSSYVAINTNGGSASIDVTAPGAWTIEGQPDWLTVSPASGSGSAKVTFAAEGSLDGRTAELTLTCGNEVQRINVIQGLPTVSPATVKEIMTGPDKTYRVTGVVTKNAESATYGNFYLNDGTSDTDLYIYGTLYNGATKQGALNKYGIEVGDEVTIEGPKSVYNGTVELVDVSVIQVNKSLIKVESVDPENATIAKDGGDFTVNLSCKGNGVYAEVPEAAQSWLSIKAIAGNSVTFHAAANEGGARSATLIFKTTDGKKEYSTETSVSQEGSIIECSVADFLAAEEGDGLYRLTGRVTNRTDISGHKFDLDTYGNFDLVDATGNVYIYGVLTGEGGEAKKFGTLGVKEGDIITVIGKRTSYKDAPQMGSAYFVARTPVTKISAADFNALADDANTWYELTGVVTDGTAQAGHKFDLATYGNFDLVDETGDVYVYGLSTGWNGESKKCETLGIQAGDKITIVAHKTSYKDAPQAGNAWFVGKSEQQD